MKRAWLSPLGGVGAALIGYFAFWPALHDDLVKFLVIAVPMGISAVLSVIQSWTKLRGMLVTEMAEMLKQELEATSDAEVGKIKEVFRVERATLVRDVADELWYRVDVLAKLTEPRKVEVITVPLVRDFGGVEPTSRSRKSEERDDEKVFDLKELTSK